KPVRSDPPRQRKDQRGEREDGIPPSEATQRGVVDDFARCLAGGGVAVFPADTVYGLGCDPANALAVERLYLLKGRPRRKAAAVMFFALDAALETLPELGPRTRGALERLLPGAVTA